MDVDAVILFFACYILHDTNAILHRQPTTMARNAAIVFTDVELLFEHILILVARSRD